MKTLEYTFTSNYDQMGDMKFTQKKREGDVAMYERCWKDGRFHSFEVFLVKTVNAGAKLPGGKQVEETYEVYPTKNHFGKTAYAVFTKDRAEERFDELKGVAKERKQNPSGRRGRRSSVTADIIVPPGDFTMFDLLEANFQNGWSKPMLYVKLQEFVKDGSVECVREQPNHSGRGKPMKVYQRIKY